MFSANLYTVVDLNDEGRKKLEECKNTLIELNDAISKCKGNRNSDLSVATMLIIDILNGMPVD